MQHFLDEKKLNNDDEVQAALAQFFEEKPASFFEDRIKNPRKRKPEIISNNDDYIVEWMLCLVV